MLERKAAASGSLRSLGEKTLFKILKLPAITLPLRSESSTRLVRSEVITCVLVYGVLLSHEEYSESNDQPRQFNATLLSRHDVHHLSLHLQYLIFQRFKASVVTYNDV